MARERTTLPDAAGALRGGGTEYVPARSALLAALAHEAVVVIDTWRRHYNEVRPHSSLGYLTPHEFTKSMKKSHHRAELALQ